MRKTEDYYLGIDIGTGSVGWAVTDLNYKLLNFNDKITWGVRLFESAQTAATRRTIRTTRRREERRKQRMELLEEIFSPVISKIDMGFFQRLRESSLYGDDKSVNQTNALFNDKDYKDKDFYTDFKTIYHLRKKLTESGDYDIRLIYLAIHHIIKQRGHFLFEGQDMKTADNIENLFKGLKTTVFDLFEIELSYENLEKLENEISGGSLNITQKKELFKDVIELSGNTDDNLKDLTTMKKEWIALISGGKAKIHKIFGTDKYKDVLETISFDGNYEDEEESLMQILEDNYDLIARLKAIYDWSRLKRILGNNKYISQAMVSKYDKHKTDLEKLKKVVKTYFTEKYNEVFQSIAKDHKHNYSHYVGMAKIGGKKQVLENSKCSQEDLNKYLKKIITTTDETILADDDYCYIKKEIDAGDLLPKQVSKDNSVIPHQVNKQELKKILDNASKYHGFFNEMQNGYQVKEMIMSLFLYRIPYYVGPVNTYHANDEKVKGVWAVKKKNLPVRPWNFDEVIDKEASAEKFIVRMTNKCTYLVGADVLPKHSLLYSKYSVLNELNNLKIDFQPVSVEIKQRIFNEVFKTKKKVTAKNVFDWLVKNNYIEKIGLPKDRLSGFDTDFKCSLSSYITFKEILGDRVETEAEMVEEIIKWITLFEDKSILMKKLEKYDNKLSKEEKDRIKKLNFSGWGRLSKELLEGENLQMPDSQGELHSIIDYLYDTNQNFIEIYHTYDFENKVKELNCQEQPINGEINYSIVQDLACSPAVKRQTYQSLLVLKEIQKIAKKQPCKIFVEMAREEIPESKKKRTKSRKERLKELYKSCQREYPQLEAQLENETDERLRSNRLYLYYTQLGRCMYSGEIIDIDSLFSKFYDRDHIYPQSLVKDDSLDNLVLVRKDYNAKKSNELVSDAVQENNKNRWQILLKKQLISTEKYKRLTRKEPFTRDEFNDFINRQLVETRQSTKIVCDVLKNLMPNTEIVYSKAGNISSFRNKYDIIKVREINDLHHAYDAYLNIVVGNVYNTKFGHNAKFFFDKNASSRYNLKKLFEENLMYKGRFVWSVNQGNKTIALIKKNLARKDVLVSRHSFTQKGEFFDQNISKAQKGLIPVNTKTPLKNTERYGGYSGVRPAYFILVEHTLKKKKVRSLESVPIYLAQESTEVIEKYLIVNLQLQEPKILINKIKMKSTFRIGDSYVWLAGRTGSQILWHNANQLHLPKMMEEYVKKLINFKNKSKKFYIKTEDLVADPFDKLDETKNLELYDILTEKLQSKYYKDLCISNVSEKLMNSRDQFISLTVEEQALQLIELIKLFTCNAEKSNMTRLGEGNNVGTILTNKKIDNLDISIVNISVAALFKQEINLNKIES